MTIPMLLVIVFAMSVSAQPPGRAGRGAAGAENPGVSPAEVQKMFDAYALVQSRGLEPTENKGHWISQAFAKLASGQL